MPTFSHLYSSALDWELGTDDSTRLFTTGRRKRAVLDGLLHFADLTECYTRQTTIAMTTNSSGGVGEYDLLSTANVPSGDYLRISKQLPEYQHTNASSQITYATGEDFQHRTVEWLNQYEHGWRDSTGGTPRFYYERIDGGRRFLGLFPPPSIGSSESAKLIVSYVAKPLESTVSTFVPYSVATGYSTGIRTDLEPFHQASVHFAAHQLEKLRMNTEASKMQLQIFLGYVERFIRTMKPKGIQTVKVGKSYFANARKKRWTTYDGPLAPWWLR